MRERPILMSAAMVRATLAGRKTQTRRVMRPQPVRVKDSGAHVPMAFADDWIVPTGPCGDLVMSDPSLSELLVARCPYGVPGDRLWVREAWKTTAGLDAKNATEIAAACAEASYPALWAPLEYSADGARVNWIDDFDGGRPTVTGRQRLARFMPRWASRITLEVTEGRVQRVRDISEEDARAEGLTAITKDGTTVKFGIPDRDGLPGIDDDGSPWADWDRDPRKAFARLWDSINGKRPGCAWADNPWVWCISFRRLPDEDRRAGT